MGAWVRFWFKSALLCWGISAIAWQGETPENRNHKLAIGLCLIELRTTIDFLAVQTSCEKTGIVEFVSFPDRFPAASPASPLYIRLEVDKEARLCNTLVWSHPSNQGAVTFDPIYLPMRIASSACGGNANLIAEYDTVSIVRWKKGERYIWLKIQRPASSWVDCPDPPRVSWSLGISARTSWEQNHNASNAHLPAASRSLAISEESQAVSTLICTDLRGSTLQPLPEPDPLSLLSFVPAMFDGTTSNVETAETELEIMLGEALDGPIYGDFRIGRGYQISTSNTVVQSAAPAAVSLCPDSVSGGETGLVKLQSQVQTGDIDTNFWQAHQNSYLRLELQGGDDVGFLVETDEFGQPVVSSEDPNKVMLDLEALQFPNELHGRPSGSMDSLFQVPTGQYLTSDVSLAYKGEESHFIYRLAYQATVWGRVGAASQTILLSQTFFAANRDTSDILDIAPFEGVDQTRECPPSFLNIELDDWFFGEFTACQLCKCENDYDCDYVIGQEDLMLMYNQFFTPGPTGDVNGDGEVSVVDALLLMDLYGSCLNASP